MRRAGQDLHACLADPRRYEREIERLHQKHLFSGRLYELEQEGVSLARLIQRRSKAAKVLARSVGRGEYRLQPGVVREIEVERKVRVVVAYNLTDTIVTSAVSTLIEEATTPLLSDSLYSYRPGVSWLDPSANFAAYVRAHRRSRPDPRTRGLYVLRRDVDSYTDSIPVAPSSRVWQMVREGLEAAGKTPVDDEAWLLVEQTIRPELHELGGGLAMRIRGVPTGQPISCVLFNLYLNGLDHALTAIPGGFYARYSDDLLFAHPDADTATHAAATIDALVRELDLTIKDEKAENLYLTGAGRSSDAWEETRGTTSVQFVGTTVSGSGTVALNRKKLRRVLRELERRALRSAASVRRANGSDAGRAVCSVINQALEETPGPVQQASASLIRRAVTDRNQLAQIDYWLARMAVKAVTGDGGVRAFRRVPYRKVREEWGLVSLQHARNSRT
jgi:Reverse transcriptase (RNA-dependent DNA polymerase)